MLETFVTATVLSIVMVMLHKLILSRMWHKSDHPTLK